ncbi:hypothetical protein Dimus_030813 [Dionaea muscipula]
MELIKRQRWENLFKKRLLVHVDAVKEFYAKMTVTHLRKKDVVKSKVRGVDLEFDNEKLATILGQKSATREMKPSQRFIHFLGNEKCDTSIREERHLKLHGFDIYGSLNGKEKGEEPKKYDFFEDTFLTMCKLTREDGIWWIGSGENRRRDDDEAAPEEEAEGEDEGNQVDFDWEAVIDEATVEGESGSGEKFYDAEEEAQGSPELPDEIPAGYTWLNSTER